MMLGPVVVVTVTKLGPLLEQGIRPDVLIMDESGQCATHEGFYLGGYARNAVFVGDVNQLQPIAPISGPKSLAIANRTGVGAERLSRALCVASGSMMTTAQRGASFTDGGTHLGVMLRYHYRCHPDIIGYSNALMYDGHIRVKKDVPVPDPLSGRRLSWVHVEGAPKQDGTSWRNDLEMMAIVDWLRAEHAALRLRYDMTLDRVVAVITPLGAQARAMRDALESGLSGYVDAVEVNGMTIGTVHALQGAEKPVVALSLVQTLAANGRFFADRDGGNLMNVAVSRAKEEFVLFADTRGLEATSGPVGHLWRHMQKVGSQRQMLD